MRPPATRSLDAEPRPNAWPPSRTTLRARILAAFLALALAMLLVVGGSLFVVLRTLHQEQASAALADVATQLVAATRLQLVGAGAPRRLLERLSDDPLPAGTVLFVVDDEGAVLGRFGGSGGGFPDRIELPHGPGAGNLERGAFRADDGSSWVYVATDVFERRGPLGIRTLVLARPDDSAVRAAADLAIGLLAASVALLAVGTPLALWLAGSVTRPLRRLAAASESLRRGDVPEPLPVEGPAEVAGAAEGFNAMAAEVTTSRRSQSELLSNLGHDLRTPLTVIGGFARALADGTARGDEAANAARAIAEETGRLERLLDDLGDLSELDATARRLRLEQVDSLALVREAVDRFEPLARSAGQTIEARVPAAPLAVVGDRTALERILGNLVRNALAAAPAPGGHVRIEAERLGDGQIMIAVRDDGPGIPAGVLPRIFERFFRGDTARRGPGSGLGLAIVRELARAHGGKAFAEDPAEGGARVGVVLPAVAGDRPR